MEKLVEKSKNLQWDPAFGKGQFRPRKKLAILAGSDPRINVEEVFELENGDAVIIRNEGALVTEDTLRSLVVAVYVLGVEKILVMGHTNCALENLDVNELDLKIQQKIGKDVETVTGQPISAWLKTYQDAEESLLEQVFYLRRYALIPKSVEIRGVIFDMSTGKVEFVEGKK